MQLTDKQREELVELLIDYLLDCIAQVNHYARDLLVDGWKGLRFYTNDELLELYEDINGESYLPEDEHEQA